MTHDVIVIGAGAAGEAAGTLGAQLGGRVAVVERDLVGGLCSFWACMPSKSLLDAAHRRALGGDEPWERAAARRDWMISRERTPRPDDASHVRGLEEAGAELVRGEARIAGRGRVEVRSEGAGTRTLEARSLLLAVGSVPVVPQIPGLDEVGFWTSDEGTSARELPTSIIVMGGGAVGVELAQVYARFGVRTTIVQGGDRLLPRDHPRSGEILAQALRDEGVDVRLDVRAERAEAADGRKRLHLTDGSTVEADEVLVAIGRRPADLRALGSEEAGVVLDERGTAAVDERMAVAESVYVAGDCSGGMQFTHVADYEGRVAVRNALGREAVADLAAVPRTTFTDPETAAVGRTLDEAWYAGIDAFEVTQDFATTARGFTIQPRTGDPLRGSPGHLTAVVDRDRRTLVGAFAACPGASELIHLPTLAIKQRISVDVLADTIGAFPTGSRVFTNLMADALKQLPRVSPRAEA